MSYRRAKHKIEYLKPSQMFRESMKRTSGMPPAAFLALCLSDNYASVAYSEDCCSASIYGIHPIDTTLPFDKLLHEVKRLKTDFDYELKGIIVTVDNSVTTPADIQKLMSYLCKELNFESLKYTFWKNNIAPQSQRFECNRFGSLFWGITFPADRFTLQERVEQICAEDMLQAFLNVFNSLYMEKDKLEDKDKDKEREDDERKAHTSIRLLLSLIIIHSKSSERCKKNEYICINIAKLSVNQNRINLTRI